MSKFRAAVVGVVATAVLVVPGAADAKKSKRAKSSKAEPLLVVRAQVLQPCLVGTVGTVVLGTPINICV